ncbi:MAG TPA: hypothetical protein VGR14_08885 [Verrucomicrobiae bacterium]|jgi:hypothetical protein|nr:hypothetical protein [Verrucomicrobiae bacterium]
MNDQEVRRFIMETGDEINGITDRLKERINHQLAVNGFRDAVLNSNAFFSVWKLEMSHGQNPLDITAEAVERTLRDIVGRLGWAIQHDLIVTAALGGQIKSRFFLSPAGEAGAA